MKDIIERRGDKNYKHNFQRENNDLILKRHSCPNFSSLFIKSLKITSWVFIRLIFCSTISHFVIMTSLNFCLNRISVIRWSNFIKGNVWLSRTPYNPLEDVIFVVNIYLNAYRIHCSIFVYVFCNAHSLLPSTHVSKYFSIGMMVEQISK